MKFVSEILILVLLQHVVCSHGSTKQFFNTLHGKAPSTKQYYTPLASFTVRSKIECAAHCERHACCVALFVSKTNTQLQCSLYDVLFADEFFKLDITSTYMFKTPFQGM